MKLLSIGNNHENILNEFFKKFIMRSKLHYKVIRKTLESGIELKCFKRKAVNIVWKEISQLILLSFLRFSQ